MHRRQLVSLGLTKDAIRHCVISGRLHPRWPAVYAVGRAELTRRGVWQAAVLTCGDGAVLSHQSAAVLWGLCRRAPAETEVSIPRARRCRRSGIRVHRPRRLGIEETTIQAGIPVTTPARTLLDVAARFEGEPLEAAVNEAVRLGLTSERELWTALDAPDVRQPGVRVLRGLLEGFMLTDSRLERLFVPIARRAGLSRPRSQERVNGFRVDFYWPDLGLVVETDGGAFHRTPAQQARDRRRDQAHTAAGLTPLRFTHLQVANHPGYVQRILERVAARLDG